MPGYLDWPAPQAGRPGRRRLILLILVVLAIILFGGRTSLSYYVDLLWFRSLLEGRGDGPLQTRNQPLLHSSSHGERLNFEVGGSPFDSATLGKRLSPLSLISRRILKLFVSIFFPSRRNFWRLCASIPELAGLLGLSATSVYRSS
jgi:hypothetical protein